MKTEGIDVEREFMTMCLRLENPRDAAIHLGICRLIAEGHTKSNAMRMLIEEALERREQQNANSSP